MRPRPCRHVRIADDGGHAETFGELAAERRVGVRVRPADVVIQVSDGREDQLSARCELA